ncbi:MAG TPA: OmpH family outer membrane protein [Chitinophagaceae bacterium]|nr:OmpH family outer membrane protein [Chitinophagaceae bacterium]
MKKIALISLLLLSTVAVVSAQRYAVIDSKYILEHMPAYEDAQAKLDQIADQWQQDVDSKFEKVDKLYRDYDAEKVMLSESLKKKRQDEIMQLEKKAQKLQKDYFGYHGKLFNKRKELIKPIQDKIYDAVQKLAAKKMYDFVLDKASGVTVFYADPKLNKSDEILKILNLKK